MTSIRAIHESIHNPPIVEFRPLRVFAPIHEVLEQEGQHGFARTALIDGEHRLKVEPELSRQCSRSHVVRATESGKEVVEGILVSNVDGSQRETPSVTFAFE
jgi:hypothetical protein